MQAHWMFRTIRRRINFSTFNPIKIDNNRIRPFRAPCTAGQRVHNVFKKIDAAKMLIKPCTRQSDRTEWKVFFCEKENWWRLLRQMEWIELGNMSEREWLHLFGDAIKGYLIRTRLSMQRKNAQYAFKVVENHFSTQPLDERTGKIIIGGSSKKQQLHCAHFVSSN